jgi:peroxiredoxin Q/BCP
VDCGWILLIEFVLAALVLMNLEIMNSGKEIPDFMSSKFVSPDFGLLRISKQLAPNQLTMPFKMLSKKDMNSFRCALLAVLVAAVASAEPASSISLKVGDKAPLVIGHDQDGAKWKLAKDIGKNVIILYFYPKDDTKGCTAEACSLRDKMVDFKQEGVEVIGVSFDSSESHKKFIFKYNINFPLIADTDGKIAKAYGTQMTDGRKMDRRISFLIGMDGRIVHITDSPSPETHVREMTEAIKKLEGKTSP